VQLQRLQGEQKSLMKEPPVCWLLLLTGWGAVIGKAATIRSDGELNTTEQLRVERRQAEERWHQGHGILWFQHYRRAGGTSLCHLLRGAVPQARFLLARGEACQPEDWMLRDAVAICEQNLTLVGLDLVMQGGNAFAQEYGPIPGPVLHGHRARRRTLQDWVFVASIREPWSRFWSQLKYELATCLASPRALGTCIGGNFEELGYWWSPTAHRDSVLGVPGARISQSPKLYIDNYYTRILLNKTDVDEDRLTMKDLYDALELLEHRISAVIIVEDFARSALQLACSLGLGLEEARPLLRKHVRPYEANEALMEVPQEEAMFGKQNVKALRARFVQRNWADYALYSHAKVISRKRLSACAARYPEVADLWRNPPPDIEVPASKGSKEGDALPDEISVDDLFGCSGGSVEVADNGQYLLKCPRSASQHADSWWSSQTNSEGPPKRKKGEAPIGFECWKSGFSWSSCCSKRFGPEGNEDCWDASYNFERCCMPKIS
jgi:hypothetical protein